MSFLARTLDWFEGRQSGHMGPDQYVAHGGQLDGRSMSGALLWEQSEARTVSATGNMVNAETKLLSRVAKEIREFVPQGVPVIDLGPGTPTAFRNKTARILDALGSKSCVLVDDSVSFLRSIAERAEICPAVDLKPIVDDFFAADGAYLDDAAVVCSFGSTISNFPGALSAELPRSILIDGLARMARAAKGGWMLVAFDSDRDEKRIKEYYVRQKEFQLNLLYRMAVELPIEGDFDATAFTYVPQWIPSSGQLAHMAAATRAMKFELAGSAVSLEYGHELHIKNSYKYSPALFEECCRALGLEVVKSWSDGSPTKVYLVTIECQPASLHPFETINRIRRAFLLPLV